MIKAALSEIERQTWEDLFKLAGGMACTTPVSLLSEQQAVVIRGLAACRNNAFAHEKAANVPTKAVCAFQKHGYFNRLLAKKGYVMLTKRNFLVVLPP